MSSLKQTVKAFCPNAVLSAYGFVVTNLRRAPMAARHVYGSFKELGPRLDEARLRRRLFQADAPMVPPMRINVDGSWSLHDYKNVGEESKKLFTRYARLEPDSSILDLGCGIGRCAIPLTHYLSAHGKYVGLDVDARAIKWCQQRISSRHQNFSFEFLDVYSNNYNPNGKMKASDLRLPADSASFDVIVAMSLFSHMFLDDSANYFKECFRLLKPGGRLLFTCFILNEDSQALIKSGKGLQLIHPHGEGLVLQPEAPETAVGHYEQPLFKALDQAGFKEKQIHPGSWCGREKFLSYQDIVICPRI